LSLLDGKLVIAPIKQLKLDLEAVLYQVAEDDLRSAVSVDPAVR
jgi:hypothetical protein